MAVLRTLGLAGATLLSLVGIAAAGFSYEALANQDYLQYGDVGPSLVNSSVVKPVAFSNLH